MKILIDADACPVVHLTEEIAAAHHVPVVLLCDTSHVLTSETSEVHVIGKGADAVDFALINLCKKGDLVVTQDYGVAAMALGKGAQAIHQSGRVFDDGNICGLLTDRYENKKAARGSAKFHRHGPAKRTREDDLLYAEALEKLLARMTGSASLEADNKD